MTDDVMADLARVFEANRQHRAARADTAWRTLTRFERRILREGAVMGYVLGNRSGLGRGRSGASILDDGDGFPTDNDIIRSVIEHCDSSDGYSYLTDACDGNRRRITRKRMWPGEAAAR